MLLIIKNLRAYRKKSVKQFCLSGSTISTGVVLELVEIGSRPQDLYKLIHRLWTCKCEGRQACSATAGKSIQFRSHTLETRMSIGDEQFMQGQSGRLSVLLRTGVGHKNKTQISDDFARPALAGVECNEYDVCVFMNVYRHRPERVYVNTHDNCARHEFWCSTLHTLLQTCLSHNWSDNCGQSLPLLQDPPLCCMRLRQSLHPRRYQSDNSH